MSMPQVVVRLGADVSGVTDAMNQVEGAVSSTTANVSKIFAGVAKTFAAVGAAVVGVGMASLTTGEKANQSLSAVAAQTGQTQSQLRDTELAIRDLSAAQGGFTAQNMRQGLKKVSRYGQTAEHQTKLLEEALRFAQASGNDFATSIYALDALLIKFNTDVSDATKFTNLFATAQGMAGIGTNDMLKAMQRIAPTVNAAGLSYEFVAAAMSQAYLEGIKVTNSSNGLANIFLHMLDPASDMASVMEDIGVSAFYANGSMRDQEVVLQELITGLAGMSDYARGAAMAYMGLTQYGIAMLDMLSISKEEVSALSDAFAYGMEAGDEYGRVMHMIDQRTGGFQEALQKGRNALRNVLYAINDVIGSKFYEWVTDAVSKLGDFIQTAKENGVIEDMAESIMKVVTAFVNLAKEVIPIIIEWLPKLIDLVVKVTQFIGDNSTAVLFAVGAFKGMSIISKVIGWFGGLKTAITKVKGKKAIGGLAPAMTKAVGAKGGKGILGGASKLLKALGPKGWAVKAVGVGAAATIGWFRQTGDEGNSRWSRMTESISTHASNLRDNVVNRTQEMATDALQRFQDWTGLTDDEMRQARDNVTQAVSDMRDNVIERFGQMRDWASERVDTLRNNARTMLENSRIPETADTVAQGIRGAFQWASNQASSWGSAIGNGVRNGLESARNRIRDTASSIGDMVGNTFRRVMGINSPSRVMMEIGYFTAKGYEKGLLNVENDIERASYQLATATLPPLQTQLNASSLNNAVDDIQQQSQQPIYLMLKDRVVGELLTNEITKNQHKNAVQVRAFGGSFA